MGKSILVKSDCKHHGIAEHYYYSNRDTYICAVCAREKKNERYKNRTPEWDQKNKEYTKQWTLKNKERVKKLSLIHDQLEKEKKDRHIYLLAKRYENTIKNIYDIYELSFSLREVVENVLHSKITEFTIVDHIIKYCENKIKNPIIKKTGWASSNLIKYHHGLVKCVGNTTKSDYSSAPQQLKEKIRKETKEYLNSVIDSKLSPYREKLAQLNVVINKIENDDDSEEIEYIKKVRKTFTITNTYPERITLKHCIDNESDFIRFFFGFTKEEVDTIKNLLKLNDFRMSFLIEKRAQVNKERRENNPLKVLGVEVVYRLLKDPSNENLNPRLIRDRIKRYGDKSGHKYVISYQAKSTINRVVEHLGMYETVQEAAEAFDRRMIKQYGFDLAKQLNLLNYPQKWESVKEKIVVEPIQKFKGVQTRIVGNKSYFIARFKYQGKEYNKSFTNAIEAALHYNKKVCEVYGTEEAKRLGLLNKVKKIKV